MNTKTPTTATEAEAPPNCAPAAGSEVWAKRFAFVQTLHALSAIERTRLLVIESDDEVRALFEVAIEEQWFEVAAELKHEMKRRGKELNVNPQNIELRNAHNEHGKSQ